MKNKQTNKKKRTQQPSFGKVANQTQARVQLDPKIPAPLPPWGFLWCPVLLQTTWKASYFPKGGKCLCWDSTGTIDPRGPDPPAAEGNKGGSVFWE